MSLSVRAAQGSDMSLSVRPGPPGNSSIAGGILVHMDVCQ